MGRSRSGNLLVMVASLALLLFCEMSIVQIASSGNSRHLGKVNAHLRAIFVAESAFARQLTRIRSTTWDRRWFAEGPQLEEHLQLCGGTYSSYIRTLPPGNGRVAELWIEARYETAIVGTYWLVRSREDTLDFRSQVSPQFFTFVPADALRPSAKANPISPLVVGMLERQRQNANRVQDFLDSVRAQPDLEGIAALLEIPRALRPAAGPAPEYTSALPRKSPRLPRRIRYTPYPELAQAGEVDTALPSLLQQLQAFLLKYTQQVLENIPTGIGGKV